MMKYVEILDPLEYEAAFTAFKTILPDYYDRETKPWRLIGACDDEGMVLGILGFEDIAEECIIRWLYVPKNARRLGVGTYLIDALLNLYIKSESFKPITCSFPEESSEEIEALKAFFENDHRFDLELEYEEKMIEAKDIKACKNFQSLLKRNERSIPFDQLSEYQKRDFWKKINQKGYFAISDTLAWKEKLLPELCLCTLKEQQINAAVFFSKIDAETLEISFLYVENKENMLKILTAAAQKYAASYAEFNLVTCPMNESTEKILDYIFPVCHTKTRWYKAEWNFEPDYNEEYLEDNVEEMTY